MPGDTGPRCELTQHYPGPPGALLYQARLTNEQDLVAIRRDTRRIAGEHGLEERKTRSLAAATYEAACLLVAQAERAEATISIGPSSEFQVVVRIPRSGARDLAALTGPLEAVRAGVQRLSVGETEGSFSVMLGVSLPANRPAATAIEPPIATRAAEALALDDQAETEGAALRRSLRQLQAELQETNRGVVALYAELDDQAERLRQAEERTRILLDSVEDYAICMLGPGGEIASWNAGAERVFGYPAEEIVGRHLACFYTEADREAELPTGHLRLAAVQGRFEHESLRVRRGGAAFDALVLITAMRRADGPLLGFALVVRDITERKRLETDLRRRADELASANRAKEDFLATLSHELRTPLNAMLGWTRLLRMGKLEPPAMSRALETIERNARAQEQLIADILDVSRIVTGKLRIALRPMDLEPIVDASVDAMRPTAEAKGVRLTTEVARTGAVMGDPDRLQQVVWNLVVNAIKFTPPGGIVTVSLSKVGGEAELRVADTGEGIEVSLLPFVFDRFTQGDVTATRPHGGLGLGLSIVRHIVELHGGQVAAESAGRGQGATFVVRLPVRSSRPAFSGGPDEPLADDATNS